MGKYKNILYSSFFIAVLTSTAFAKETGTKETENNFSFLPIEIINIEENISNDITKLKQELQEKQPIKKVEEKKQEQEQEKEIRYNVIVSYYTHLPQCTTSGDGITASGKKVSNTSVAIPRKDNLLNFGDTIIFDTLAEGYMKDYNGQYLTRIADDTGNPNYIKKINNDTYKLDVYCPKLPDENDTQYINRVRAYGITKTKITIKNNK